MTKLYDQIKQMLEDHPNLRSSDKNLIWKVWELEERVVNGKISEYGFATATSPESITRARRKVQELCPWLQAQKEVRKVRTEKAHSKGTFVFREQMPLVQPERRWE